MIFTIAEYDAGVSFVALAIAVPWLGLLYYGWRAWDFVTWWTPVEATTLSSDYSDAERLADTGFFAWLKPHPWSDAYGDRRTRCRIAFTDGDGGHHQVEVTRMVHRGSSVAPTMRIYYDRRNPGRVDVFGFTGAMTWCVIWSATLLYSLWRMTNPGVPLP